MPSFMRSWPCVLMVVAASSRCGGNAPLTGPTPPPLQNRQSKVVTIDAPYGTLRFQGTIRRLENVSRYVYVVQLTLTFDVSTHARTRQRLSTSVARASRPPCPTPLIPVVRGSRSTPTGARSVRTSPRTARRGRCRSCGSYLPKITEAQAGHVGVSVTDGHFLWPVPGNLKDL